MISYIHLLFTIHLLPDQGHAWGQNESTQGVGMGGGVPLPYIRKKNQNMNLMVASPAFSEPKHRLNCFQNKSENSQNPIALVQDYYKIGIPVM